MRDGGQPERPAVHVLSVAAGPVEREVLAGIEEEGVPFALGRPATDTGADELAHTAARVSSLDVGVGIDQHGRVCISHEMLTAPMPDLACDGAASVGAARAAGHNAARIVVGVPLRLSPPAARSAAT